MNFQDFFKDKIILVCGGTGTIGSEIVAQLLQYEPRTIRILTNSENELWNSRLRFKDSLNKLRFLLGDIRDYKRINRAMYRVDYVFNAAAIKHVPISEYNPMEAVRVNVMGLDNIIQNALQHNVRKFIQISTDKAINPTTVMGATKMLGERLVISRELAKGTQNTILSCVRFGNVLGSRGSIIPLIKNQIKEGDVVTLTDKNMKRFFLSINQAVKLVLQAMIVAKGGEVFVLKMPTILIKDLIEVIIEEYAPKVGKDPSSINTKLIGSRSREKLDETLISPYEFTTCIEIEDMYCIYPDPKRGLDLVAHYQPNSSKVILDEDFHYSTKNSPILSKEELRKILLDLKLI